MPAAPIDIKILRSDKTKQLEKLYEEKFGERFMHFNYADFDATEEKCAAEVYQETIERALQEGKPYHIVSRLRNPFEGYNPL